MISIIEKPLIMNFKFYYVQINILRIMHFILLIFFYFFKILINVFSIFKIFLMNGRI